MPKFMKSLNIPQPINPPAPSSNSTVVYGTPNGIGYSTPDFINKPIDISGLTKTFDFDGGNKIFIGIAPSDLTISNVILDILGGFDDTNTTISIGDDLSINRLMNIGLNDPNTLGSYESTPNYQYSTDTNIYIYINGTNIQGSGAVKIYFN